MARQFHQNPTEFFSIAGAPYPREHHGRGYNVHERRTDDQRPRMLEIGVAAIFTGFCAVALGASLFASSGTARLVEVAYYAVR
jgi:hypothetical protein